MDCFKAYDIRGRVPDDLNAEIAYRIGRAYAAFLKPMNVIIGRDIRLSSAEIAEALSHGLNDSGVDVLDIGLCGTEEVYHATFSRKTDGGIMVTASHNPADYNGMKLVRKESRPVSGDSGLNEIREMITKNRFPARVRSKGSTKTASNRQAYIDHLLSYINSEHLRPLRIVVNSGNGCAGSVVDLLDKHLPFEFKRINHEPDGRFPNGVPNPLLPENRSATRDAVLNYGADIGVAWDGDFDRCFLFDEKGDFIEGYYIVGLLASSVVKRHPGARIIHDPRLTWNTIDIVKKAGGIPVQCKTGHAFIKERMRQEDAVYGGEMSAHHYFRDFAYCDSGMIPWMMVAEVMGTSGKSLSELVGDRIQLFPASGEINRRLSSPSPALKDVEEKYRDDAVSIDHTDGLSMEFPEWRFNLRSSNTEPVVRLNVESRGNMNLLKEKTDEILTLLNTYASPGV
jgi:phosphomannomutase/phosphomannomutase/phosphoglucomutase